MNTEIQACPTSPVRRHDLDALRGFAMLLGIGLHAVLSFLPFPWPVQDSRQSEPFILLFLIVHGFRMPLFFVVSGFFTAMLWRRYGTSALLRHRALRVLAPCLLGLITVIPAMHWVSDWVLKSSDSAAVTSNAVPETPATRMVYALKRQDRSRIQAAMAEKFDVNARDSFGITMLSWTILTGDLDTTRGLLDRGAEINAANTDTSTPAHVAVFVGYPEHLKLLKERGANLTATDREGRQPSDVLVADRATTESICRAIGLTIRDFDDITKGRQQCRDLLPASSLPADFPVLIPMVEKPVGHLRSAYADWLMSDRWMVSWRRSDSPVHLFLGDSFAHLWFLWFLCSLVGVFVLMIPLLTRIPQSARWKSAILSPLRMVWLFPLTMLPQLLMGTYTPSFGPDTSAGFLPQPHVLIYYAVFFGYGAMYHEADDVTGRVGQRWIMTLSIALSVCFPIALITMGQPVLTALLQVSFTWLMIWGCLGLFRHSITQPRPVVRYLSDASYWLYLAHLPLVIAAQHLVRAWNVPPGIKWIMIVVAVTAVLLLVYEICVRYTWLGALLNGRKYRAAAHISPMRNSVE